MSGDREKKPAGWYSKDQRAARAAAFAERKAAAAVKREGRAAERAKVDAVTAPLRAAAARRLAALPDHKPVDNQVVKAARARTRKVRQRRLAERQRDVIDVRKPGAPPIPPTPEQSQHADYVVEKILDRTPSGGFVLTGRAFRRRPRFETIEGLTGDDRRALKRYRAAFDRSEQSETKCALDIRPRGGGGADAALARLEDIAFSDIELRQLEAAVKSSLLPTLRAVALHDHDFKTVAIARFGSREVSRIDTSQRRPIEVRTIEPRSGRHRTLIRDEFLTALAQLVVAAKAIEAIERPAKPAAPTVAAEEPAAEPAPIADAVLPTVDPAYLDDHGRMRPFDEIRQIIVGRLVVDDAGENDG